MLGQLSRSQGRSIARTLLQPQLGCKRVPLLPKLGNKRECSSANAAAASAPSSSSSSSSSATEDEQKASPPASPPASPASSGGRKVGAGEARSSGGKGLIDTNPPRGTRDFAPDDMRLRSWLFGAMAQVSSSFGFSQYDVPVLESEELFVRKAGEEITDQLYNFQDKGGRRVALRPEITPSLARLVLGRGKALALPAKWWTIGQCWRYERTTRGRRREHYQWNMDIIGVPGVEAEAELLAAVTSFFARVGLTSRDVGLKVSSRKVLQALLARYGVAGDAFAPACVVVDKLEKLPREEVVAQLGALGVPPATAEDILAALAAPSLDALEALLGPDGAEAVSDLRTLWALAEGYGYADWLVFDASVVRGLAYYTGVVFEGFDRAGQLRAICGGGRYDKLLGTFGGADEPCAGFGFGDAVIVELLKDRGLLPSPAPAVDDVVVVMDEDARPAACGVAARLRAAGRSVDVLLEPRKKLKAAFKAAERAGASRLLLVGGDEWTERRAVVVRDLAAFEQKEVPVDELV